MRVFTIKHKGKSILSNMIFREILFPDESKIFCGLLFYRKKDAKKYLETYEYKEFYEIIGMNIDQSKHDNRFNLKN